MRLPPNLVLATFLRRLNRFAALVLLDGQETLVHVANSGRMRELLEPGRPMLLAPQGRDGRKTAYDLALVDLGHTLVSADARLPTHLVQEAILEKRLAPFQGFTTVKPETTYGGSRLDFCLSNASRKCLLEVKSVTLVEDDIGLFPDAPTSRGTRHLRALVRALSEGYRASVVFVIQREDAHSFAPNHKADPLFSATLHQAIATGVEAYACRCRVSQWDIRILDEVPVLLGREEERNEGQPE